MKTVAVLFARADSVYFTMPECDVYDMARDARTYDGPLPIVAHPPCRAWGRLRKFANPRPDERNLARLAVALVREFGGVLEHPAYSTLWDSQKLPRPQTCADSFGGWTLSVPQYWWGHKANKSTWLYIVGVEPRQMPRPPFQLGEPAYVVSTRGKNPKPEIPKADRERTPPDFARWLVHLASACTKG